MKASHPVATPAENRSAENVAAIEMHGVTVGAMRDQKTIIAEEVNWRVDAGEFWAVAGFHGAGKSDLLMLAGGLMAPLRGSYKFLGEEMPLFAEDRLSHQLKLGLVFDGGRLFNELSIAENIALPLRYHRNWTREEAEPVVNALLELTDLAPCANVHPGSLGRNVQRRAALARALALKPEVLLLDTPMTGMDRRQQNWWLNFLKQLSHGHPYYAGQPVTLVVTTPHLRDWRGWAGRFALLEKRRLNVLGDWSQVEQNDDPLVRELIAPPASGV